MRLRSTALPTCLVTVKPNRGSSAGSRARSSSAARLGLEDEGRSCAARALADPQVFGALLQRRHARGGAFRCLRLGHGPPIAAAAASCRQALAALRAPPGHDRAAAHGCHAVAESMPALAHELARLVGPFHVGSPSRVKPLRALVGECRRRCRIIGPASTRAQTAPHSRADRSRRAYRIGAGPSQSDAKSLYKRAKPIKSFRFLSRVLDSRAKWGWQRLLSL